MKFFDWLFGSKPKVENKCVWVGTVHMPWVDNFKDQNDTGLTVVNLFEAIDGTRTITATGTNVNRFDDFKVHRTYGNLVVPFLQGCNLDFICKKLVAYNIDYWEEKGYDVSKLINDKESYVINKRRKTKKREPEKIDDNVLKFPTKED